MTLKKEIEELKQWISNRPSATLDPFYDLVIVKRARLRELTAKRRAERLPSKMMESQVISSEPLPK